MRLDQTLKIAAQGRRKFFGGGSNLAFTITVVASLFLHGSAIAALMYMSRDHRPQIDVSRAIPVQLVKLGKPRDPKLLPRKVAPPAPPPADEGVALDSKNTPKDEKPKSQTREKTPELSAAAKKLLESENLDRSISKIEEEEEGALDGDEYGTTTDATNAAAGYLREIMRALRAGYTLPETIPQSQRQFLKARVVLFIERDGRISRHEFIETHPNTTFMNTLERLLKTIKLPPPPADQARALRDVGIVVIFSPA